MMNRIKWFPLVAGVITLFTGIYFLMNPVKSVGTISWFIVFAIFFGGLTNLIEHFALPHDLRNIWSLIQSILTIIFAFLILITPMASLNLLITFVAYWIFLIGILRLIAGFQINRVDFHFGSRFFIQGTVTVIFGVLLLSFPLFFTSLVANVLGIFLIFLSALLFVAFYRLNKQF